MQAQIVDFPGTSPLTDYGISTIGLGKQITGNDIPGYDPGRSPQPQNYGTATPLGLLIAKLQTPCVGDPNAPQGYPYNQQGTPTYPGYGISVYQYPGQLPVDGIIQNNYNQDPDVATNIYTYYQVDSHYDNEDNVIACPIGAASSNSTDTFAFVNLSPRNTIRTIRVAAERVGAWPKIPAPQKLITWGTLKMRLLSHHLTPKAPKLNPAGSVYLYSMDAEYKYAFNRPLTDYEKILVGSLPWDSSGLRDHDIDPTLTYSNSIAG
jgi:hypothetical protein